MRALIGCYATLGFFPTEHFDWLRGVQRALIGGEMVLVKRSYLVAVIQAVVDFESGFVGELELGRVLHSLGLQRHLLAPRQDPCLVVSDFAL